MTCIFLAVPDAVLSWNGGWEALGDGRAMAMKQQQRRAEVQNEGEQVCADAAPAVLAASVGSSPPSLPGKAPGDHPPPPPNASARVKLMCSHGGKILPRPHDNQLRYVGGDTRIVVVDRRIAYADLAAKLAKTFGAGVIVKYQLPSEDLDALVSVTSDEDLENMMEECDRLQASGRPPSRLRLFLFPRKADCSRTRFSDLLDGNLNREHWFVDALNGVSSAFLRARSESSSVVSEAPDYLSGLDSSEDWSVSLNSRQSAGEKYAAPLPLGPLLHGSGDLISSPGSPVNRSVITIPWSPPSSAPSSISSMPSAVVDVALQLPNVSILHLEELPPNLPVHQKLAGSDIQDGAAGLRLQQAGLGDLDHSNISDPSFVPDEYVVKIAKVPQPEQEIELPVTAMPPKIQLQPMEPLQRITVSPDNYLQVADSPLDDAFETREENTNYTRMAFKPVDVVKQGLEIQKPEVVILPGHERLVKKVSEERLGERTSEPMRKNDDQDPPRRQLVEPIIVSSQQGDGFESVRDMHGRDQIFIETSESEIINVKEMEQKMFYAQIGDSRIKPDDSVSTYATQPPAVRLQNFGHPPMYLKNQVLPAHLLPSQLPQIYSQTTPVQQATIAVSPDGYPFLVANPAIPHYQRQISDPVQHVHPGRVPSPYREHPSAHASPARFGGVAPAVYQNPSDMKRILVTAAGTQVQLSRPPLNPHYTEQIPYIVTSNVPHIEANAAYATYNQCPIPGNVQYGGLNPFLEDMPQSSEVPSQRVYQEIYVDPTQDPQGVSDGRLQYQKYTPRN